ncbi:FKBP-type peptidyl-prolyl cis-trans isomerase [Mucilaginibacter sp.]|uniref:FKBP-type peptidyl-prolyl cis-trans isomerase n=1 Tax=Mucilaginibacter sp. TaxID=1882438 RepID=UPI003B000522
MKKYLLFFAVFTILFSACKKSDTATTTPTVDPAVQAKIDDDKIQAYLAADKIIATKDASGLYYVVVDPGSGTAPTINSTVRVAYTGQYLDKTVFQTVPNISFPLSGVIKGWQIGIPFIKSGGRIILYIPSALAYGPAGRDSIPPNTVLIFTIDLFQVQG